jgi:zinc/manganese transport system permease protein
MARPLLFASIDPDAAAASGVPVRGVSTAMLVLLGIGAASASQITGALLVFALLVLPPATAQRLTARPGWSALVSVGVGVTVTWAGLALGYYSRYPIGFYITTIAFCAYVLATAAARR